MRDLIEIIDRHFSELHNSSVSLVREVGDKGLFLGRNDLDSLSASMTCGEQIVRSGAVVEQAFGGISARLWDDPFEWTLPEELSTAEKVEEYLYDVDAFRKKCMLAFGNDSELSRTVPAPEELRSILEIFLEAMTRSANHLGKATLLCQIQRARNQHVRRP